jgi:hypothetical protein
MVILRGTKKVLRYLAAVDASPGESTNALGDWYANRLVIARQPVLLLVSSNSLLPALVPARDVRGLPSRLASVVEGRLRRLGVREKLIEAEIGAMETVSIAKTSDRSVLGTMNDFARIIPFYLDPRYHADLTLESAEERLEETPCRSSKSYAECIFPDQKTVELLELKWG